LASTFQLNSSAKNCCCFAGSLAWISQWTTPGPTDGFDAGRFGADRLAAIFLGASFFALAFFVGDLRRADFFDAVRLLLAHVHITAR
jgi:hypothetical protein